MWPAVIIFGALVLIVFRSTVAAAASPAPLLPVWPVTSSDPRRFFVPRVENGHVVENDRSDVKADRYFGASREGGRRHAGIDLVARPSDPIVAVEDGVVIGNVPGYVGLDAVVIRHPSVILLYGEIAADVGMTPGTEVKAGQQIGRAARSSIGTTELHIEAWDPAHAPTAFMPWMASGAPPAGLLDPTPMFLAARPPLTS